MKRFLVLTMLAGLCALAFASAAPAAPPADVGWEFPLSGPYGAYAEEMKRGVDMAVEEWNAKGGVLGKPVKVLVRDSELKADVALRRMKEYVDSGINIIGGNLSGGISMVINQWANKNKVLYMSTCHNSLGQGKDWGYYGFTTGIKSYMTGAALADFAFDKLGKKWMVIAADYRWGHDQVAAFLLKSKKAGGKFLGAIYTPIGTRDFSAYVPQILAKKPDFLVLSVFGSDLVSAIKQFGELGLSQRIKIALPKTAMPIMKECGSSYNENVYGAATWYWTLYKKYPNAKPFVDSYTKKFGRPPDADADSGYVGAQTLFMAMEKAGTRTDVDKIIPALEGLKWNLNHGPEHFRKCDHVRTQTVVILQGLGTKAKGWDLAKVIAEVPPSKTMLPCDVDRADTVYGPIRDNLPGK
ncbi:MAG: ABC transporter substrate-binding protein [Desulfarculaceae bacterium]|nr:ABC transporter substrate-binding protein [Desulfarculaceae bacterium]MCF8046089.1 ABC transporter substrate-binding protein [Desulfarculaceae bacterium]MCF8121261.1 ABC transporter substrate-binding protein [Desulfarculaceae bacterium]